MRNSIRCLATICAIVLLNGCFYAVTTTTDDFNQITTTRMKNNRLPWIESGLTTVELNVVWRDHPVDSRFGKILLAADLPATTLTLVLSVTTFTWLFIEKGESLIFLLDGKRMALKGSGSAGARDVLPYGGAASVLEIAAYKITPQQLYQLARAGKVRVKIVGSKRNLKSRLNEINQQRFRDFYEQHVQGIGAVETTEPVAAKEGL